jgi:Mn-dependent DtxR family transcriptional regulator
MQDERTCSIPATQTDRIERAILALLLAEDHPWRMSELSKKLGYSPSLIAGCVARLHADGVLNRDGDTVRTSRATIRVNNLTLHTIRPWNH